MKDNIKEDYEFENKIIEEINRKFKSATIWGNDGGQIILGNLLRETIRLTKKNIKKSI